MHRFFVVFSILAAATCLQGRITSAFEQSEGLTLYVSTGGNDSWSGNLSDLLPRNDGPLRSLQAARNRITQLKESDKLPPGPVNVYVRGGIYEMKNTFELSEKNG